MSTIEDVERAALAFPPEERARIAVHLLHSLPVLPDEDESVDELELALQRDAELDANAAMGMSLEEFQAAVAR